ncbi:MAG: hypothetical protein HFJ44_08050 [Clostridia bacterium]|jgi:hypothetical protein|nr:hypothetical protein [Clostridia bacterium]
MDIEGLKQEGKNQLLDKYIEEYNNMGYMDYINNNLVYSGVLSYNMMKDFMGGRFMEDPIKSIATYSKLFTSMKKTGKGLFESQEEADERKSKAEKQDLQMKLFGAIQEYDPATFKAMLNGDTEGSQYLAQYMENLKTMDPETISIMEQALEEKDWHTFEAKLAECVDDARISQYMSQMSNINPNVYDDMIYAGGEIENNNVTSTNQIPEGSDLEARIASLENTVYQLTEYIQREGIQVSENGVDFVQQARDGEEKDDKSRAIYEKDGVSIEVAEGLEAEQNQELQHGQEFAEASEEVTEEDLEIAEKEVKERDAITEDGTVSIILGNSKKITISVEPYIAGDKETQMAQEANEQEQMASREENSASTEITDDTSRV